MRRFERLVALYIGVILAAAIMVVAGVYVHDAFSSVMDDLNELTTNKITVV